MSKLQRSIRFSLYIIFTIAFGLVSFLTGLQIGQVENLNDQVGSDYLVNGISPEMILFLVSLLVVVPLILGLVPYNPFRK